MWFDSEMRNIFCGRHSSSSHWIPLALSATLSTAHPASVSPGSFSALPVVMPSIGCAGWQLYFFVLPDSSFVAFAGIFYAIVCVGLLKLTQSIPSITGVGFGAPVVFRDMFRDASQTRRQHVSRRRVSLVK